MSGSTVRTIAIVLLIIGAILLVVGVIYFVVPIDQLPAFLGQQAHRTGHRSKRGTAALLLGVLVLIGSAVAFMRARRAEPPATAS